MTVLPQSFLDLLSTSSNELINKMIEAAQMELEQRKPQIHDLVKYIPDFNKDEELIKTLREEGESLGLTSGRKVATQYLNSSGKPYIYPDTDPIHRAKEITDHPGICELRGLVNGSTLVDGPLPACLALRYSGPDSALSLHADDEKSITQDKDIAPYSVGRTRSIQFYTKAAKPRKVAEFGLEEGGLLIMKAGTQKHFMHIVRAETEEISSSQSNQPRDRLVFSFRDEADTTSTAASIPKEPSKPQSSEVNDTTEKVEVPTKRITLIAGDSYAERLDVRRLGKAKKEVVNIARGGYRTKHVESSIKTY